MLIAIIVAIVVVLVLVIVVARVVRGRQDPVDSFRRQIDALSPEARRPTIDQVRDAAEDSGETDADDS
ncbi:hypothetical protein [Ilumatobacter nonamiensis]|uniref:hypothetical protein n=1 Tax=Ilumatobacter nonamiensis TaxID=467093 RepID=UPI0003456467|nr:hypothetical protein [Ilumatobacter nonamiensis]